MPKSKRSKVYNLTQVSKKGREQKDKLFSNIREAIPEYQQCFVFNIDNMRNNYLKEVRRDLSDSRYVSFLFPLSFVPSFLFFAKATLPNWTKQKTNQISHTDSSSARQNSPPAPWARPRKRPKPTASTTSPAISRAPSASSSPTAPPPRSKSTLPTLPAWTLPAPAP